MTNNYNQELNIKLNENEYKRTPYCYHLNSVSDNERYLDMIEKLIRSWSPTIMSISELDAYIKAWEENDEAIFTETMKALEETIKISRENREKIKTEIEEYKEKMKDTPTKLILTITKRNGWNGKIEYSLTLHKTSIDETVFFEGKYVKGGLHRNRVNDAIAEIEKEYGEISEIRGNVEILRKVNKIKYGIAA